MHISIASLDRPLPSNSGKGILFTSRGGKPLDSGPLGIVGKQP
jgi:hypothetical protein